MNLPLETFTLANGLQVVVQTDRTSPIVAVSVTYRVGSQNERPGRSGFAHLFEHLMAQGTKSLRPREISLLIESNGGVRNAYTTRTHTNYHSLIPRAALQTVLWAEAERMHTLNVDARALALEKQVVLEEMRLNYIDKPYRKARDAGMAEAAFARWENRHTTIGEMKDVQGATLQDVRAFYDAHYAPNNAVLALAGDVALEEARALAERYFAAIPAQELPALPELAEAPLSGESRRRVEDPMAKLPLVMAAWTMPARGTTDFWALSLLDGVLSAGESSPLYQALVKRSKLALGVEMTIPWWVPHFAQRGPDLFGFIVTAKLGTSVDAVLSELDQVLARFAETGPTAAELSLAKTQAELAALAELQSLLDRANFFSAYAALTGPPSSFAADLAAVAAVSAEDVRAAVKRWLIGRGRAVVEVVPGTPGVHEEVATPEIPAETPRPPGETPPALEVQRAAALPALSRFTLGNGLKVVFVSDERLPLLEARLALDAGTTAEKPGEPAVASAAGALMLKGAGGRTGAEISSAFKTLGFQVAVGAGAEFMSLAAKGLARNAGAFLHELASVLAGASYPEAEVALWRENTLQRLKDLRANPDFLASEKLKEELFGSHPYGQLAPNDEQLARITSEGLRVFHAARVRPGGATLVLVGALETERARELLESAFSGWSGAAGAPDVPEIPANKPARLALVDRPGSSQANLVLAQTVALTSRHPDHLAFLVANQILGGSATSRLFVNLRVDKGYTYGSYSRAAGTARGMTWSAEAQVRNEVARAAAGEMFKEVARLREEPIPGETLESTKRYLAGLFLLRLATSEGVANAVAQYERDGKDAAVELSTYLARLDALTAEDLRRVARTYLDPAHMVQVVVGDAGRLRGELAGC